MIAQLFQSTPAITGERAHNTGRAVIVDNWFQSTPAITGERAINSFYQSGLLELFQSTPAITGERAAVRILIYLGVIVSIHARHYWRASQQRMPEAIPPDLFQSTPAITGERAWHLGAGTAVGGAVSIHARHYWRASHPPGSNGQLDLYSFNPRPPLLASEPPCWPWPTPMPGSFNPRPPLLASEPGFVPALFLGEPCFNPRPPLLASEPGHDGAQHDQRGVSIHARHYWRASR